jgi:hypothetical protein
VVRQQTQNEFLCLTDLQRAYDALRTNDPNLPSRHIQDFSQSATNLENIYYLLQEAYPGLLVDSEISEFTESVRSNGFAKRMKEFGLWKMTGRGENRVTYCNPYLFVAIALWLNPRIYARVVIWLTDQLIANRIGAGDHYKAMCQAINDHVVPTFPGEEHMAYTREANMLNCLVFGTAIPEQRQIATNEQLELMNRLQEINRALIENGLSFEQRESYLAKITRRNVSA